MRFFRRGRLGVPIAIAVGLAAGGIAYASIPDSTGAIRACYKTIGGALRVIDPSAGGSCSPSEMALSWNQSGLKGATGAQGLIGPIGATGPSDAFAYLGSNATLQFLPAAPARAVVESMVLPAGQYVLNASVVLNAQGAATASAFCHVFLGPTVLQPQSFQDIDPTFTATLSISSAFTLNASTTVTIQCGSAAADTVFTQPSTMTAVRVGSLTTS